MIRVCSDMEAMSRAAAEVFAAEARRAVETSGRFAVALAGGSTPRRAYEILSDEPFRKVIPWLQAHIFWGDERCVAETDPRSNARMARQALLDHVPLPAGQTHPMACDRSPREAAESYEKLLRGFFEGGPPRFDLVLLGLGSNGHTASLFPDTPVLAECQRWVAEVRVPGEGIDRLTLTVPVINRAQLVVFLVSGREKAAILKEALEGRADPCRVPAMLIRPEGRLLWLVDREAAARLEKRSEYVAT